MSTLPDTNQPSASWHAGSPEDVAAQLDVDPARGLSFTEAGHRLAKQGPNRLSEVPPRGVLLLRTEDAGAPHDIPAWCRLTGNTLLHAEPPAFWIRRG